MSRVTRFLLPVLIVLALLLVACQPETVVETVVVTEEVVVTEIVEVEKEIQVEVTPQPKGDTIRIGGVGPLSAPGSVVGGIAMQFAMNLAVHHNRTARWRSLRSTLLSTLRRTGVCVGMYRRCSKKNPGRTGCLRF